MHRRHLVLFLHSLLSVVSLKHLQVTKNIFQTDRKWGFKWSDEQWFTSPFWKTIEVRYVLDIENATEDKEKRMQTFLQNPFLKKKCNRSKKDARLLFFKFSFENSLTNCKINGHVCPRFLVCVSCSTR